MRGLLQSNEPVSDVRMAHADTLKAIITAGIYKDGFSKEEVKTMYNFLEDQTEGFGLPENYTTKGMNLLFQFAQIKDPSIMNEFLFISRILNQQERTALADIAYTYFKENTGAKVTAKKLRESWEKQKAKAVVQKKQASADPLIKVVLSSLVDSIETLRGVRVRFAADGHTQAFDDILEISGVTADVMSQVKNIVSEPTTPIKDAAQVSFQLVKQVKFKVGTTPFRKGGIDLTPTNMNLQTKNNGSAIVFHIDPVQLAQLQNSPGFVPVIINIKPLNNIRRWLGIDIITHQPINS